MTFEIIRRNYDRGLWNKQMVAVAVTKSVITAAEYYTITNDKDQLKAWVIAGILTAEQYQEITGEAYVTQ